ncbi:MAG: hypothetical protein PH343_00240 [Nitrospira sp.]|nr:hypothetical protein [Nitrospira sp.]
MYLYLKKNGYYAASLIIVILSVLIYFIQIRINSYKGLEYKIESFMMLPKAEYLKPIVLGYEQIAGDIIWLKTIQVVGEEAVTPRGYDWVYHALDVVTTLDPKFSYAYEFGGVTLAVLGKQPELSNKLLEKGLKENPDVWQIPFYLGFNNFFYFQNYKLAAAFMAKASEIPGHPEYLPKLAARLYVEAGDPDVALDFLYKMYKETKDAKVKASIEIRIKEVIVERDITTLERAVSKFKDTYKSYPNGVIELVRKGLITHIPDEPFGGSYFINTNNGSVYSNTIKRRLKVYEKGN